MKSRGLRLNLKPHFKSSRIYVDNGNYFWKERLHFCLLWAIMYKVLYNYVQTRILSVHNRWNLCITYMYSESWLVPYIHISMQPTFIFEYNFKEKLNSKTFYFHVYLANKRYTLQVQWVERYYNLQDNIVVKSRYQKA